MWVLVAMRPPSARVHTARSRLANGSLIAAGRLACLPASASLSSQHHWAGRTVRRFCSLSPPEALGGRQAIELAIERFCCRCSWARRSAAAWCCSAVGNATGEVHAKDTKHPA
jgi:hypothetical protein